MQVNKKIKNAASLEYDGISFKSKLEKSFYVILKEQGFPVKYEPERIIVWEGFKPTVPFYNRDKVSRGIKQDAKKVMSISYTPDFMFTYKGYLVVIEAKGFENDVFPIKRKLFRAWLERHHPKSLYFELYSQKQLQQAIAVINNL